MSCNRPLGSRDTGGGGTPTGWQLIGCGGMEDYPVRAVALKVGSVYRFGNALGGRHIQFHGRRESYSHANGNGIRQRLENQGIW